MPRHLERNAHEADGMKALAARFGVPTKTYSHITPTIYGGAETLPSRSPEYLVPATARKPFRGCAAGRTAFHVNPHGMASMCKVGREPNVALLKEGVEGLTRLAHYCQHKERSQAHGTRTGRAGDQAARRRG